VESPYANEFILDDANFYKWSEGMNQRVGRYPEGYRHLETFENYRMVKPGSTVEEYAEEMNAEIHFDDYLNILRQAAVEETKDPVWIHENADPINYFDGEENRNEDSKE